MMCPLCPGRAPFSSSHSLRQSNLHLSDHLVSGPESKCVLDPRPDSLLIDWGTRRALGQAAMRPLVAARFVSA